MSDLIYIVPCGAGKVDHAAPAADLYTGSMFRYVYANAVAMAEEDGGRVLILSAEYGLLDPTDVVAPYNTKMGDANAIDALQISMTATEQGIEYGAEVFTFLPKAYYAVLAEALDMLDVYPQDIYEASPGIGYQRGTVASCGRFYAA